MSQNGTFKSVVRPNRVLVTTDLAGVLSFATRATSLVVNSGQSASFTSTSNTEHLIPNQIVDITNRSGSDIIIAAALMEQGVGIDIEHDTTVALIWTSNGKFYDIGGSSRVKNIEENLGTLTTNFEAHKHNGTDAPKVLATDIDATGGAIGDFLVLDGAGMPYWHDPLDGTAEQTIQVRNTNNTTDLNIAAPGIIVPIAGTTDITDENFTISGNGIIINNYSGWIELDFCGTVNYASNGTAIGLQFAKNGTVQPGKSISTMVTNNQTGTIPGFIMLRRGMQVVSGDTITLIASREGSTGTVTMQQGNCVFTVRIPTTALARGPQGQAGNPNWSFHTGFGVPSTSLGVYQDVYLNKTNSDLYRKVGASLWQLEANIQGDQGPIGPSRMFLYGAKAGSLVNNAEEWSFGTAFNGQGIVQMMAGKITHLSLNLGTAGTSSVSVEILKNSISTGQAITLATGISSGYIALGTQVTFVAGDVIGFRTVLGGGSINGNIAAMIELT